jgi:hypothetical protein
MDRGGLAQNVVPAVEIAALFDEPAIENVHLAADELGQLFFDLEPSHVGWTLSGREADQEVDIAFSAEILAQKRAKDLKLGDLPPPAEGCQLPGCDLEPLAK